MSEENQTLTREELASVAMRVENLLGWEERQSDQILLDAKFVRRLIAAAEREMKGNAISQTMDRIMAQGEAAELAVLRAENKRLRKVIDDIGFYCAGNALTLSQATEVSQRCLAALSAAAGSTNTAALRPDGQTAARGDARPTEAAEQQLRPTTEENLTDGEPERRSSSSALPNQGEPKS